MRRSRALRSPRRQYCPQGGWPTREAVTPVRRGSARVMLTVVVEALMRSLILAALLGSALATVGCAAHVGYAEPYGGVDLVYAAPGVQVIADYDEPIFYSDGFYWRQYGGGWYR